METLSASASPLFEMRHTTSPRSESYSVSVFMTMVDAAEIIQMGSNSIMAHAETHAPRNPRLLRKKTFSRLSIQASLYHTPAFSRNSKQFQT